MTALQKITLGTPPKGQDGDSVNTGFTKVNSNVDVLDTQVALTSAPTIIAAQALSADHIGKRVNINLPAADTVNVPPANVAGADAVLALRNVGTTVVSLAIAVGSGDSLALSRLNPGESVLLDTDGVHTWSVLMRGRTNADDEVINGDLTVGGALSAGTLLAADPGAADSSLKLAATKTVDAKIAGRAVGRTLIQTQAAAASTAAEGLVFLCPIAKFNNFELVFSGLIPTAPGALGIQLSPDGGSTWKTAANYQYNLSVIQANGTSGAVAIGEGDRINMFGNAGNTSLSTLSGRVRFYGLSSNSSLKPCEISVSGVSSLQVFGVVNGFGMWSGDIVPVNAFRVICGSGSPIGFSAGTFSLYGLDQ